MKLFAKLMIAVLVLAILLPFTILKDEDGNTLMSFSDLSLPDFSMPSLPNAPEIDSITDSQGMTGGNDTIYQWHDDAGNVQFTTDPPPQGIEYQVKQFDPEANVIQAVEAPSREPATVADGDAQSVPAETEAISNPYAPQSIEKFIEDAKNVEKLLRERFQSQESAINQ